jgi:hypothetical protein
VGVHDRPSARELLDAVRDYIREEIIPTAPDRRARFRALIAANVLAIVERELGTGAEDDRAEADRLRALGFDGDPVDARRRLAAAIRAGEYDAGQGRAAVVAYALEATAARLRAANPGYLTSFVPYPLPAGD